MRLSYSWETCAMLPCQPKEHFSNCLVLFRYLYSSVHASSPEAQVLHSEHAMLCVSASHTCNAEVSRDFHDNHSCWWQLNSSCDQRTSITTNVVDDTAYSSASVPWWMGPPWRMNQIFGSKASQLDFLTGRKMQFHYPTKTWCLSWGWFPSEFCRNLLHLNYHDPMFSYFGTTPTSDRWIHDDIKYCTSILSRR